MAINKRLLVKPPDTGLVPSENFGVVLYEGDGASSHSINGGKFGAGAYFNGSTSNIDIGAVLPNTDTNCSASAWVYIDSGFTSGNKTIIGAASSTSGTEGALRLQLTYVSSNTYQITLAKTTGTSGTNFYYGSSWSSSTINVNQWYHIIGTYNSTNRLAKIYLNGSLVESKNLTNSASVTSVTNVLIGGQRINVANWSGKIDQVRIFQKELSSSEVSTLYAETASTVESLSPLGNETVDTLQVLGDSSCIATYRFENNEDDLSGNYDGTGTNIQYVAGRYGQAASFNGSDSQITTSYNPDDTNAFSWSSWINVTNVATDPNDNIFGTMESSSPFNGVAIFLDVNDIALSTGGSNRGNIVENVVTGTWYHVAITYNGSGTFKTYKDGSLVSSISQTPVNGGSFWLGNGGPSSWNAFDGKLDQVRVFNKELSASEVTTLYEENSLVASYRFEGNANDDTRNYDGTASNVTYEYGLNFTPDFIWLKSRSGTVGDFSHTLMDSTRGASKSLSSNNNNAEVTNSNGLESFDTGGFTVGSAGGGWNYDGTNYVGWCLKANGGTTSSNTDGDITSTVQANTNAGFSIVTWTSTSDSSDTIGHGLNSKPDVVLYKKRSSTGSWFWYTDRIDGSWDELVLNTADAKTDFAGTYATSTTFKSVTSSAGADWITYCFHSVDNFSKFGKYVGNGSSDGPIIETGFEPAFLMIRRTDTDPTGGAGNTWIMYDNLRSPSNPRKIRLWADGDAAEAEYTQYSIDFLSNGFQLKDGSSGFAQNTNGGTYIYMAIAADPDTEAPTVADSFAIKTYTGTGSTQSIDGLGFAPSLVWIKSRTNTLFHNLVNSVVGENYIQYSNSNSAGETNANIVASLDSDGFTVGNDNSANQSGQDFVAWAFKADDNEPTINDNGSIDSIVSANANAGFSIVKYTGDGSTSATIGHNLSAAPEMVIIKNLSSADNWIVYNKYADSSPASGFLQLNQTAAFYVDSDAWGGGSGTEPSSTLITIGDGGTDAYTNKDGSEYIAYCFHSVSSFSSIGSYTGNASTTGPIITTGFEPSFVMIKAYSRTGNWVIFDSVRDTGTVKDKILWPNEGLAEVDFNGARAIQFLSNGFQLKSGGGDDINDNSETYIYWAVKIN